MVRAFHRGRPLADPGRWSRMLGRHSFDAAPKPLDALDAGTLHGRLPDGFSARFGITIDGATLPCVIAGQRGVFVAGPLRDEGPDRALGTAAALLSTSLGAPVRPLHVAAAATPPGLMLHGIDVVGLDNLRSYLLATTDGRLDWLTFKHVHAVLDTAAA